MTRKAHVRRESDESTMKRFALTLTTIAALTLAGSTPTAQAQEVSVEGPLAGAPAVVGLRIYRALRFQVQLHATMTLQDEYTRTVLPGGQLNFHLTDWLGIGIWGGYGIGIDTALTDQIVDKGQTNSVNVLSLPNRNVFAQQIGRIKFIAAPQLTFIPLRGKLGLFEKLFVDTDFYVFGGVGIVGLEERKDVPPSKYDMCFGTGNNLPQSIQCFEPTASSGSRSTRVAIAPTFGAGLSLFLADFVAMTIEWRGLPFAWNTSGTDESGFAGGDFPDKAIDSKDWLPHFNHMMTLGFAFYFPTKPKISTVDLD
jgi:outer membrane beta-barrel protein